MFTDSATCKPKDNYGDHVVSCAEIIGIEHCHNVVRDTLVDICYHSAISASNEVDIGLDGGRGKPLRLTDIMVDFVSDQAVTDAAQRKRDKYTDRLDVCVDLTGSSPLTQTGMVDFVSGQAVTDAAQRKRDKYMDRCAAIGYGFLLFYFPSLGELEAYAVILQKQIQNFSITQDIEARTTIHIFNRISFTIAKRVGAQIVSRLPFKFCKSYEFLIK
nr:hypothetical protein [Tanacetum cinerariifolium]